MAVHARRASWLSIVIVVVFLTGCSSGSQSGSSGTGGSAQAAGSAGASVTMNDANQFVPVTLTIQRGTTVTWTNSGQVPHTVTDDPSKAINKANAVLPDGAPAWDSGTINGGQTFSHTFDIPGQYTYFCIPHESLGMVARLTVT
jgi:plastocyanin